MDATDFLVSFQQGNPEATATLFLVTPDGDHKAIRGLDVSIIEKRCINLAYHFEAGRGGRLTATLVVPSFAAGVAVIRWIHLDDYMIAGTHDVLPAPVVLLHAEVRHLAVTLDCVPLQQAAQGELHMALEIACSLAFAPLDLHDGLVFLYKHLDEQKALLEATLHYCVTCFDTHNLGANDALVELAKSHSEFHKDLSRVNAERGYENMSIPRMAGPTNPLFTRQTVHDEDFYQRLFVAAGGRNPFQTTLRSDISSSGEGSEADEVSSHCSEHKSDSKLEVQPNTELDSVALALRPAGVSNAPVVQEDEETSNSMMTVTLRPREEVEGTSTEIKKQEDKEAEDFVTIEAEDFSEPEVVNRPESPSPDSDSDWSMV